MAHPPGWDTKWSLPYTQRELFEPGRPRQYQGRTTACLAFPVGGIGTGCVSLGGRGELRDWEIFNSPNKGRFLPYTFFAIRARRGEESVTRVLERRFAPPYGGLTGVGGSAVERNGVPRSLAPGLPRLDDCRIIGEFPIAWAEFSDEHLPVIVSLEAFSPFVPMNDFDSGLPVAVLVYYVENPANVPVHITLVGSLLNAVGYLGPEFLIDWEHPHFGGNLNEFLREAGLIGLRMTSNRYEPDDPRFGSMALVSPWRGDFTYLTHWARQRWLHEDLNLFWTDLVADGLLDEDLHGVGPSPDGRTDTGSLGLCLELGPGESAELPFIFTWYFPNRRNNWTDRDDHGRGRIVRNWYAQHFDDAWDVARYVVANLERLRAGTTLFHDTLFDSTLPALVIEAISSQLSTLRTNTVFRDTEGHVFGFEGCGETVGCCPMNCTHVWNYVQAVAYLFPSLERAMREIDFLRNTDEQGNMAFRTLVPLGPRWQFKPAADGQMGTIMRAYREWQMCGDDEWLARLWPSIKQAMEFAWRYWDLDQDGVMEAEQHTTYDVELYGPNTMAGAWYLGALRALEEMASLMGEPGLAERCRTLFQQGSRRYDELCWNGEYYVQRVPPVEEIKSMLREGDTINGPALRPGEDEPRYQYGNGCLSNQLVGQFAAMVYGLGYLLPPEHVRQALQAVFRHNWRPDFLEYVGFERAFALNDEAGLVDCSWPYGDRPVLSFPSADATCTGYEYQYACLLLYEGFFEEGLAVFKAVRERHDGERRNPWNEFECGDHYSRSMANWAALLALSGFQYSAPKGWLQLKPRFRPQAFKCFWSAGASWGSFEQKTDGQKQTAILGIRYGALALRILELAWASGNAPSDLDAVVQIDGERVEACVDVEGSVIKLSFPSGIRIGTGQQLVVTLSVRD